MSYLHHLFNQQQPRQVEQSFNSVENFIKSIVPLNEVKKEQPKEEKKEEKVDQTVQQAKILAENLLLTEKEKREIETVNEEIEKDLREAFLGESVKIQDTLNAQNYYKLYRDRDETFECKISVEGASLGNSSVRLILESDQWNIMLIGKIYKDGRCVVPLKKMTIFPEGTIGKAHLEVIIDDTVFVPWEETFIVEGSKKVTVEIKPQTKVSVNLKADDE